MAELTYSTRVNQLIIFLKLAFAFVFITQLCSIAKTLLEIKLNIYINLTIRYFDESGKGTEPFAIMVGVLVESQRMKK